MRFDPFAPRPLVAVSDRHLLCEFLTLPAIPDRLSGVWSANARWWELAPQLQTLTASELLNRFRGNLCDPGPTDFEMAVSLFSIAYELLAVDERLLADRCLQKGLKLLAGSPERSRSSFDTVLWIILAVNALKKDDPESCESWLRQAGRSFRNLTADAGEQEEQQIAGDLLAIEACLQFRRGHAERSRLLLSEAFRCHTQAENVCSGALDLILKSRCLAQQGDFDGAETLLQVASRKLRKGHLAEARTFGKRLTCVVERDLAALQTHHAIDLAAISN